ncbi:Z-ring formation inhibitor MciZ [Neobacillus sp. PS3-34]|nr:Z-ring formation inhibitor MciZ [Neobacillus sp. PS3-34]WML47634.1 Z-ring formation inhibitor MciZ [Neobacillus sp. PS3-34]
MKVYLHGKGFILVGKGWEVVQKLKEYNKQYSSVAEWIQSLNPKKC